MTESSYKYLYRIDSPADLRKLSQQELVGYCDELRRFIIEQLALNPGHLGSSLGVVELTAALHYVFDTPYDKLIWDVGHQAYAHKIITGRRDSFRMNRKLNGLSGFPKMEESAYDAFGGGHASTSISAALGIATATALRGERRHAVAVIGDGALTGGLAFEGLNNAGAANTDLLVILNDNRMAIDPNVGALKEYLLSISTSKRYNAVKNRAWAHMERTPRLRRLIQKVGNALKQGFLQQSNLFESLRFRYFGPVDGHDVGQLTRVLQDLKEIKGPKLLHVLTVKGKGYSPAERDQKIWHAPGVFNPETGEAKVSYEEEDYSEVTAQYLLKKMEEDSRVVTITSGTPAVLGFTPDRRKEAGKQFVDVGIAEEHAVALASGIAANGGKPVYGVYSTFIQRSYDQLSQDLCINNNPAVLLVFWGTLSGMNDVTHLCFFDIPLISNIPNMVYLAPTCKEEYLAMLEWSIRQNEYPVAIRVPATDVITCGEPVETDYSVLNRYKVTHRGSKVAILALGSFYGLGQSVASLLKEKANIDATLINPRYITGVDNELMDELKADHELVITLEDGVLDGGFGEKIARYYGATNMKVLNFGAKKEFVDRYDIQEFLRANHLTDEQIVEDITAVIG